MSLEPGKRLGPYEVLAPLGAGGMGEVYRARDSKLGREVAVKVLPDEFAEHPKKLARFEREARLLASLNHTGIATLYGVEQADGRLVLAMELVEGETLAERISRGPIPVDEALPIALQIAEALEAAHEKGVIHRDLKPANIKVDPEGRVKVLDFGLAKALAADEETAGDLSQSPTLSHASTQAGVILGTAAYMSPEQAKGRAVDKRSDIFSFGVVLFEMLTGKKTFAEEDVSEVLAAIIRAEPDWTAVPSDLDPRVQNLLRRCLKKDRKKRFQAVGDVRVEIEEIAESPRAPASPDVSTAPGQPPQPLWRRAFPFAAGVVAGGMVIGAAAWAPWVRRTPHTVTRFSVTLAADQQFGNFNRNLVAISPDGRHVVVKTSAGLLLRAMDSLEPRLIPGTEGNISSPCFSADGESVAYYHDGQLKRVALSGGAPVVIGPATTPWGVSWEPDDTILFGQGEGILRVPATGGTPEVVVAAAEGERMYGPHLLPGGDRVLFSVTESEWDAAQVVAQSLSTGTRTVLVEGGSDGRYVPTGHLVYALEDGLFAVSFDVDRLAVHGGPVSVTQGVMRASDSGSAHYGVSEDGTLVYVPASAAPARTLVWVDRQGREEAIPTPVRTYLYPRLSPDGTKIALDIRDPEFDIWVWDLTRATLTRLTVDPGADRIPIWTPDGQRIAFNSNREDVGNLFWRAADGTGSVERLSESETTQYPTSFSPDGTRLVFSSTPYDIALLTLEGEPSVTPLVQTPFVERNGEISPDGRWLAYQSDESGQEEIYVRPFPDVDAGRWPVSTGGGSRPLWARSGEELFYLAPDGAVMRVGVEGGATFRADAPTRLFRGPYFAGAEGNWFRTYDVSPDGQRFLMVKEDADGSAAPRVVLVQNWTEELKRLVPAD